MMNKKPGVVPLVSALAVLAIWGLALFAVLYLRDLAVRQAETNLRNLSRALAAQTEVMLTGAEAALDTVRNLLGATPDDIATIIKREAASAPFLQDISVYDGQGVLTHLARQPMPAVPVNFSDRAWFTQARDNPDHAMLIGDPVRSKINNNWLVPLVIRRGAPDAFAGAVAGSLDPGFFQSLFGKFELGEGAAITLQRADSTVLARQPHREESVGKTFPGPIFKALQGQQEALVHSVSIVDGAERLISGRFVGQFPVYVAISVTQASVLRSGQAQTAIILGAAATLSALIIILAVAHAHLARHQIDLREKVAALNATTRQMKEQAEELGRSNAELEQFAYVASHDLRAPLRMVTNFLALAERRLGDTLDSETREFIDFAVDGARRMDHLILDLLQYARIGRDGEAKQPSQASEAIAEALANLQPQAEECAAEITVAPNLPPVLARESDLIRLFQNLVGNALKYRDADRPPRITIAATRRGAMVDFTISDNGIGILPADCERIFGIFKRLHANDEFQGTGIGLAVCRKIVDSHGGRIRAESAGPGTGTRFEFTLPAA
jgi:signal transduction histidine kinase